MKRLALLFAILWFVPAIALAVEPLGFQKAEGSGSEAHKHNEEGILHFQRGHYEEALKHFHMASIIDPAAGEGHYNEALSLHRLGRHKEAAAHFHAARQHARGRAEILESSVLKEHLAD